MRREFLASVRGAVAEGPRPRQMLLTLLADYWLTPGARVPSSALVELMGDFGITEAGARTVLSRLSREERVVVSREGRRTFYALSSRLRYRLLGGLNRISTFGWEPYELDRWTCVAFSVPEDQRGARHKLRTGLQWLGFAPLYDGLWVCPRSVVPEVETLVTSLGITAASVFQADITGIGAAYGRPTDAWDLGNIQGIYRDFLSDAETVVKAIDAGAFDSRQALVWRTELMNVWRAFPKVDPGLPESMLPPEWPRQRARAIFERLYLELSSPAQRRIREVVTRHQPEYAELARAHGIDGLGAL
ncbi:hypothetical protein ABL57_18370 [Kocuria sp. SM24M-10]|nr:hypothetical protein ABL57_18370 [Kocuria sp. SM24M-10]